jgi:hypothetical protein
MPRKTYNEKLHSPGELPKIEDLSAKPEAVARFGGTQLLVAAPMQYNDIMSRVPEGRVITADRIRAYLAAQAGADTTCPLTAGFSSTSAPTPARSAAQLPRPEGAKETFHGGAR